MKLFILSVVLILLLYEVSGFTTAQKSTNMTVHDFKVKDTKGNDVSLSEYKGKVLLIINSATECGFTPQYKELQELYVKYKDQGFEILDFPCNQFGGQAPGSNDEIASFCELNYQTTFPRFSKIDVKGDNADPLFIYLTENSKSLLGKGIKWNFTKFLIDKQGKVSERFAPTTKPSKISKKIESLLIEPDK